MPVDLPTPKVGTKPDGNVCTRAARAVAREAVDVADSVRERGLGFKESVRARFSKVSNWVRTLGPAGEELGRQMVRVSDGAQRFAGSYLRDLDRLTRLPKDAQRAAAKAHYYGTGTEGLTGDALKAYEIMDGTFGNILGMAKLLEVKRVMPNGKRVAIEGSGKGYPSILSKEGERIVRDAMREGGRQGRALEAAIEVVMRNHETLTPSVLKLSPDEFRQAKLIAMGVDVKKASAQARQVGQQAAELVDWGYAELRKYHENAMRGVVPYLERTRIELPEFMLDFNPAQALPGFLRRQGLMLAAFREWGQDMNGLRSILQRISSENSVQHADLVGNYIRLQLGRPTQGLPEEKMLLKDARDYMMLRIFGGTVIGPLRNAGQPFTNAVDQPVSAWVRSLKELPPLAHRWIKSARALRERVIESGARSSENPLTEFGQGRLGRLGAKAAVIHRGVVAENEYRSAVIGYLGAQENIARLVQMQGERGPIAKAVSMIRHIAVDPEGATARALERTGVSPQKIAEIRETARTASPEQLKSLIEKPSQLLTQEEWLTAMRRASLDTQFGYEFATRHVFSGQDDSFAMLYMLKNWGVRQLGYIHNHVLKEVAQGNAKPLVKLLATTFLLGEVYNNVRDFATGSERSMLNRVQAGRDDPQTLAFTTLRNIGDGGGLGILMDALWGWNSLVFGPLGGTVTNMLRAGSHVVERPGQAPTALKDFLDREFVVTNQARGAWNRIKAVNEAKHQRYFDYGRWRDRSFAYTQRRDAPTVTEQVAAGAARFLAGDTRRAPGDRSLSYEQAAKAITGNNVEAAADYIATLLRGADRDERASILQGLQTVKRSRSPLGPVPQEERNAFLRQFSTEERQAARRLQREWERDFDRAVRLAERRARIR